MNQMNGLEDSAGCDIARRILHRAVKISRRKIDGKQHLCDRGTVPFLDEVPKCALSS